MSGKPWLRAHSRTLTSLDTNRDDDDDCGVETLHRGSPVLVGVEHAALLAHGLGVGDGRGEEAVPLHSAVQTRPLVVSAADIMDNGGITK